ncbi:hypothetical protein A3H10_02095 [Candidatus Uhrbacteria bacterium RIFCSPLOWO2_12_FULL_46_10]|uniref:Dockerin domain-containing protein n=1 Tax=Candidatus Uhrbacteria bacterium RIFCSPLOWO2_01_FULL_47_25 TaxID=1802402 RepID=A0A1F7UZ11_9BACT|nr:MAG: hypothetical protein UX68_C0032G0004 [Parcubacteria group bacterium GW2011_GWA2_46_9]OGL60676.1 MAG: hypothetical protein A2752_04250 [Candidatus Uhrbacteria bacterium RIFCSPHIGHO2_01_FULL_46_23]OGL70307.1 MAG: hypothetical protein A3D60_01765 [Candidatus Uhrbacteria bacterium RIFCSPHIGHO2_02_FULL_47_29]OGL75093.1 MAG: hypothetical protein A3E96_01795 [Candidatus Uhrbacteria bacterium RIFCSPHIGHO2_12_FULL_46_13]OGL82994.1 MAG: hypothetical protein A2936_03510 [Candidatus Uhrbacteria bac
MEFKTQIIIFCGCVVVGSFFVIASNHVIAQSNSQGVGVSITIEQTTTPPPTPPPSGGGGGGGGSTVIVPSPTDIATFVMKGKAYPKAIITILRNGAVTKTLIAGNDGLFEATISGLPAGLQTFGVYAQDTEGKKSVTLSFTLSLLANMTTTLEGLIIPVTIEISSPVVNQGNPLFIYGQSFPESNISLFIQSKEVVKTTATKPSGNWRYELDTAPLDLGDHAVRAKAQALTGEQSEFSETKFFRVIPKGAHGTPGSCPADLNDDNRVDITDLSILLYNWGTPKNTRADYNKDGRVDIVDFSILLYYWGTCV